MTASAQLASRLTLLVEELAESYCAFATNPDADPKAFAAHHTACKVALAHLDLLLKLIRSATTVTVPEPQAALIFDARRAVIGLAADFSPMADPAGTMHDPGEEDGLDP